jgi:ketosteroid isomerase-like protein
MTRESQHASALIRSYFANQGEVEKQLGFLHSRLEWHVRPDLPDAGVYHGHSGFRQLSAKFQDAFVEERYQPLEFIEVGADRVLVPLQWRGRGRQSGAPFVQRSEAWLFTVEQGLILTVFEFPSKEAALEAARSQGDLPLG